MTTGHFVNESYLQCVTTADLALDIGDHVVQFYESDAELVESISKYLATAISAGDAAIVVATDAHRCGFEAALTAAGIDVAAARDAGTYAAYDAATMVRLLTEDTFDSTTFDAVVGSAIRTAAATGRPVRAYGEMVALLWEAGDVMGALELEALWNGLARRAPFSLFCAYPSACVSGSEHADALRDVCHLHSSVVGARSRVTVDFPAKLASPAAARQLVENTLQLWGCDDQLIDNAALAVTEMATNAVVHEGSPFTVVLEPHGAAVRLSVQDLSRAMPTLRDGELLAESGRGLRLVAAVATQWGAEPTVDGKVVWADFTP